MSGAVNLKPMFEIDVKNLAETETLAGWLAGQLYPGDCVVLSGPLGVGKTALVQALGAALGIEQTITSPTFPILNVYRAPAFPLLHIDAYRLASLAEFRDLGIEEYFDESVTLIEWGEKYADEFPDRLEITVAFAGEQGRRFAFVPVGSWVERIESLIP